MRDASELFLRLSPSVLLLEAIIPCGDCAASDNGVAKTRELQSPLCIGRVMKPASPALVIKCLLCAQMSC